MKNDHYCIDCKKFVHVGIIPSKGELTTIGHMENGKWIKNTWDSYECPLCKGVNIIESDWVRKSIIRKHKIKRIYDSNILQ